MALREPLAEWGAPPPRLKPPEVKRLRKALDPAARMAHFADPFADPRMERQNEADAAARLAQRGAELSAMKLRALQRCAEEAGVDEEALEEAEDREDLVALILAKER